MPIAPGPTRVPPLSLPGLGRRRTQHAANTAKHFAFTRCGELNLYGMVDAQIAVLESELLADNMPMS